LSYQSFVKEDFDASFSFEQTFYHIKKDLMASNTQVSSTQMHKAFFGQGMILFLGWMFETLLNI